MSHVVRNAALMCVAGILVASAALANVPDPAHSSFANFTGANSYLDVEGATGGNPDACTDGRCGNFTVTIRDFANNVIAGSTVVIDFSGCSDIQIACDQLNAVTGQTYLAGKKVSGTTNAAGQFVFKVQGASNAASTGASNTTTAGTNAGVACAQVYADGVALVPQLKVSAYDVNGTGSPSGAVSSADISLVSAENSKQIGGAQPRQRDDYNHTGTITIADVSAEAAMAAQASTGSGSQKTAPYCP
jgi:hypothetical protein